VCVCFSTYMYVNVQVFVPQGTGKKEILIEKCSTRGETVLEQNEKDRTEKRQI